MALDTAYYLVTMAIAKRSGLVGKRYIAPDGRFILDNKDLSRVRFTTEEYISGLNGVERISEMQAQSLIAEGGYRTQPFTVPDNEDIVTEAEQAEATEEAPVEEETQEPSEEAPTAEEEAPEEEAETEAEEEQAE